MSFYCVVEASESLEGRNTWLSGRPHLYRGPTAPEKFLSYMRKVSREIFRLYSSRSPSDGEAGGRVRVLVRLLRLREVLHRERPQVRDHSHLTGAYRGPAHATYNARCRTPNFVPVMFHNLSGYDAHFIVKALGVDPERLASSLLSTRLSEYPAYKVTLAVDCTFVDGRGDTCRQLFGLPQNRCSDPPS